MSLALFEEDKRDPSAIIELDPRRHKTGDIWHVCLSGIGRLSHYAYLMDGGRGCFDPSRLLLDPYARQVATARGGALVARLTDDAFDWQGSRPLRRSWRDTILYETHVRGLTRHPSSKVERPGSYLGAIEKIPHLLRLGVTAVEFMPVQHFADHLSGRGRQRGKIVRDYWGYNPVAFFAPKEEYASRPGNSVTEFKTLVREFHKAGLEVILDLVFNHTGEGDEGGQTLSFRGIDNAIYYLSFDGVYSDYTGCGNTLNCNHPVVRHMILDCLRYWAVHMHVDGFRFDLASVLGRDASGRLLSNPPLIEEISEDPILRDVKLIAEPWDGGGAFQVGSFPGQRWSQWNSCWRDDVRRFWRGDPGMNGQFATRLCGSADLFGSGSTLSGVNFITSHDGFTLDDLVSYGHKHNEANGEDNLDGIDQNFSDNNGCEGPSGDPEIETVRIRQIKNFMTTLVLSRGVPMLLGGDEFRRTQLGNNNAYCQDNSTSWYDWDLARRNDLLIGFVSRLVAFRKVNPVLRGGDFYAGEDIAWFAPDGGAPDWTSAENLLGCVVFLRSLRDPDLCFLFNASRSRRRFVLPRSPGSPWGAVIDTAAAGPQDIAADWLTPLHVVGTDIDLVGRSTMVLTSWRTDQRPEFDHD